MEKDERRASLDKFFTTGPILNIQPGSSKRVVPLTDFDSFEPILTHRGRQGRVFCPFTKGEGQTCAKCEAGEERMAVAAVPLWNITDKKRQLALWAGPKKGTLHSLYQIFNTVGTHRVVIQITREGSGIDTTYAFVPVATETPEVPESIVVHTQAEVWEILEKQLREREEDQEW